MKRLEDARLISFEGIDGCGKTTLQKLFIAWLTAKRFPVKGLKEPGTTPLGYWVQQEILKKNLFETLCGKSKLALFLAARVESIQKGIEPLLNEGHIVVLDRYNDSTVAYQGAYADVGFDLAENLTRNLCGFLEPDLTIYIDIDPELALKRLGKDRDYMEDKGLAFFKNVREHFQTLARKNPSRIKTVDGTQSSEDLLHQVKLFFDELF